MRLIKPVKYAAITLAEAKKQLNIETDWTVDDDYILSLIAAATAQVESFCDRKIMSQTWRLYFDTWSDMEAAVLPYGQLQAVDSVKYFDADNSEFVVDPGDYIVSGVGGDNGRIEVVKSVTLENNLYQVNPIEVDYTCGCYKGGQYGVGQSYDVGDAILMPYDLVAVCTTAGTTGSAAPDWAKNIGESIIDGTVVWIVAGVQVSSGIKSILLIVVTMLFENREPNNNSFQSYLESIMLPYRIWTK